MKQAPSQWLQYLAALSLSLSSAAYSLPAAASTTGTPQVSQQAATRVNDMAQSQVNSASALPADWLQIIWTQVWGRIIIIVPVGDELQAANTTSANDFGSYKALLDSVKQEA